MHYRVGNHILKSCRSTDAHMPMSEKQLHRPLCQGVCGLTRAILSSLINEPAVDTDKRSPVCSAISRVSDTYVGCRSRAVARSQCCITWKCKGVLVSVDSNSVFRAEPRLVKRSMQPHFPSRYTCRLIHAKRAAHIPSISRQSPAFRDRKSPPRPVVDSKPLPSS